MNDLLEKVKALKLRAKANIKEADSDVDGEERSELHQDALSDLKKARLLLLPEYESFGRPRNLPMETVEKEFCKRVAFELADCFGITGGLHRRRGEYDLAATMYDEGKKIEENSTFEIQSTYNTVNSIVLKILNDPATFKTLTPEIESTLFKVRRDVEGPGRGNWWSWADYGLLSLLSGNMNEASYAYRNFKNAGALNANFQTTINVLEEIRMKLSVVNNSIANKILEVIRYLAKEMPVS